MLLLWAAKPAPFTPAGSAGLAAWFRQGVGQTVTGSGVSTWADQSGNGRDLLQGTDANRPALQGDGTVLFDGTNHFMKCSAFTLNQPTTVYILGKQITWTSTDQWYDGNAANTGKISQVGVSPNLRATSDGVTVLDSNPDLALDTYGIVTVVFNGASSLIRVNSNAAVTGDLGAGNMGGFNLGSRTTTTAAGNIQVKEVVIYSVAHDTTAQDQVIAYLNTV